jgi:hypothetical protein
MKNATLLFSFFALALFGCKKEKVPENPADKMNGTRKWHGSSYGWQTVLDQSTGTYRSDAFSHSISDSSILIQVSGPTINFGGATMQLDSTNTGNHTLHYSDKSQNQNISYYLTYYYLADSIKFDYTYDRGHAGVTYIKMRTP